MNIRKISKLSLIPLVLLSSGVFADSLTIRFLKPLPQNIATSDYGLNGTVQLCYGGNGGAIWGYNSDGQLTTTPETDIASDSPNYGLNSKMGWSLTTPPLKNCIDASQAAIRNASFKSFSNGILTFIAQGNQVNEQFSITMMQGTSLVGPNSFTYPSQGGNTYYFQKCADFDATSIVCCFSTDGQCDSPPF